MPQRYGLGAEMIVDTIFTTFPWAVANIILG